MPATPLRYPGGKAKLTPLIARILEDNDLCDGVYVEPYAGGAGLALELLQLEFVRSIRLNDIDAAVHAFWVSLLEHTDELCRQITDCPLTIENWRRQREIYQRGDQHSILELGFAFLFLNRTNRSGILKGGVIGGLEQTGKWKIDARFNRADLCRRAERIARYRSRIEVTNLDACDFLRDTLPSLPEKALTYLDPPYYVKGQRLYKNHYEHADHAAIVRLLRASKSRHWVVSYDDVPAIRRLLEGFRHVQYSLQYSARERRNGSEIMFFCDSLKMPAPDGLQGIERGAFAA